MDRVNVYKLEFDINNRVFRLNKSLDSIISLNDYNSTAVLSDNSCVRLDAPLVLSECSCIYYTTSTLSNIDITNKLKDTLISINRAIIAKSTDIISMLNGGIEINE